MVQVPERREPVQPPAVTALLRAYEHRRAAASARDRAPMGQHDMVWPAARPVEEVRVFARRTSEGAAPKDRPPLFFQGGVEVVHGAVAPVIPPSDRRDVPVVEG